LFELLQSRYNANATNSKFVFTGNSKAGYLVEPQEQIKTIVKMSGITFTIHDLRRTFITIAESIDIPAYTLKRLLNHKSQDITNSYICIEIERLRKPMQLITNKILSLTNTFNIDSPIVLVRLEKANIKALDEFALEGLRISFDIKTNKHNKPVATNIKIVIDKKNRKEAS